MIDAANKNHWNLIITKAGLADIPSSENVFVHDFLPGEAAMRASDVTVCQGGSGTINQAIAAGCPFVGVASNSDQEWNLDRAFRLGLAKVFYGDSVDPAKVVGAVEEILANKDAYHSHFAIFAADKRKYLEQRLRSMRSKPPSKTRHSKFTKGCAASDLQQQVAFVLATEVVATDAAQRNERTEEDIDRAPLYPDELAPAAHRAGSHNWAARASIRVRLHRPEVGALRQFGFGGREMNAWIHRFTP
jgi:hypothetical protein